MADAGPLIALAKVGGLEVLFATYRRVLIPPAVHDEAVLAGHRRGSPDAVLLHQRVAPQ